ncbi:MAG: SDR family oxidoreductase [Cyclobacteriaceae bacterium]|nr:SDR family oxidoreductase [Cyclobacteriaceae bacterium]
MSHISLKNMTALITGASRGIGRATAIEFVKAGAQVALHYNRSESAARQLEEQMEGRAIIVKADLSQALEVGNMFNKVIDHFGKLDVLVNNAGIAVSSSIGTDDIQWIDDWLNTMDINLNAAALLCKKAIQHYSEKGGGRIINLSSRAAFRGDTAEYLAYAASKGGLVSLTKSIARAYGKKDIKAFVVAPGFVKTDMANDFLEMYGEDYIYGDIALNRITEPSDVAKLIVFLASGMADHSTGATFDINAGSYMH